MIAFSFMLQEKCEILRGILHHYLCMKCQNLPSAKLFCSTSVNGSRFFLPLRSESVLLIHDCLLLCESNNALWEGLVVSQGVLRQLCLNWQ